jgi:hypothetical protein
MLTEHTFPSIIASSNLRIFSLSNNSCRIVSGSYSDDPASISMVFRRARLCSDSGVVEAKYEIKDVSLRLEAYDDATSVIICSDREV